MLQRIRLTWNCNFIYSLLGIETSVEETYTFSQDAHCNFIYSLLGIETHKVPSHDMNLPNCNFIYSLLGIETIKSFHSRGGALLLQFHLLPIRDWNLTNKQSGGTDHYCNFIYSLLGIETRKLGVQNWDGELQFHLLPIRDWNGSSVSILLRCNNCNFIYSLLGIETSLRLWCLILPRQYCNFIYSLLGIETKGWKYGRWRRILRKIAISFTPY